MTVVTKDTMKSVRAEVDKALEGLGKKLGVSLKLGNGTYDSSGGTFSFKLVGSTNTDAGKWGAEVAMYEKSVAYGVAPAGCLGKTLTLKGKGYRVLGMKSVGGKVVIERLADGKVFLTPATTLCALFPPKGS